MQKLIVNCRTQIVEGRSVSFHSNVSNLCFCSDLALGDALPPPHSTFVTLRWLRLPPKLSPEKTEGLRQVVPRNSPAPQIVCVLTLRLAKKASQNDQDGSIGAVRPHL
jgi:hypothetical protein